MKPPAFQFYADDFLAGVADMTQAEVGAYILLLCHQWNGGAIPTDPARAELIAKGEVSPHVLSKFPNGKNPRLERVRKDQKEHRKAKASAGKAGADKRWHTHASAIVLPLANGMAKDSSPSPTPSPTPSIMQLAHPVAAKAAQPTDAEWLDTLTSNPAYSEINIGAEYGKCQAWNGARNLKVTRRKFVAWLNRAERPMPRQVTMGASNIAQDGPLNWRATFKRLYPEVPPETLAASWGSQVESIRREIQLESQ